MTFTSLVDSRLGIIRRVEPRPLPRSVWRGLHAFLAWAADTSAFTEPIGNPLGAGCSWWDPAAAQAAAIGEAVERYAATLVPPAIVGESFSGLTRRGLSALDPTHLALLAPAQYRRSNGQLVPFTRDTPAAWIWGEEAASRAPILVPWSVVTLRISSLGLPRTNLPVAAGLATAPSRETAENTALAEVVERDAFARAWAMGRFFPPLEVPKGWAPEGPCGVLTTRLFAVPNRFRLPTVLALVRDTQQGLLGVGLACRPDAVLAARKAIAEAAMMLTTSAELADPAHPVRIALEEAGSIKPYRADRRYMESYAPDWHDVVDLVCHVQLTLDPAYQQAVDRRLHSTRAPRPLATRLEKAPALATLLTSHGYRPVVVDITPADVRAAGLVVARALVPGLATTAPAAVPHLGHCRPRIGLPPPFA